MYASQGAGPLHPQRRTISRVAKQVVERTAHKQFALRSPIFLGNHRKISDCFHITEAFPLPHVCWNILPMKILEVLINATTNESVLLFHFLWNDSTFAKKFDGVLFVGIKLTFILWQCLQHVDYSFIRRLHNARSVHGHLGMRLGNRCITHRIHLLGFDERRNGRLAACRRDLTADSKTIFAYVKQMSPHSFLSLVRFIDQRCPIELLGVSTCAHMREIQEMNQDDCVLPKFF